MAKTYLLQDMNDGIGNDQETATLEEANSASSNSGDSEPSIKHFKHLSRVSILLDRQQSNTVNTRTESIVEELELQHYSSYQPSTKELSLDSFTYWSSQQSVYLHLALVACEILATPASTAPVERIFSSAGEATRGKRNRLTHKNLEKIFLHRNRKYL